VRLIIRTGREVQGVGVARRHSIAKLDGPETVDRNRLSLLVAQGADKVSGGAIGVDSPVAKIPDKNVAAELSKVCRRLHDSPRSVERTAAGKPPDQIAIGVEL